MSLLLLQPIGYSNKFSWRPPQGWRHQLSMAHASLWDETQLERLSHVLRAPTLVANLGTSPRVATDNRNQPAMVRVEPPRLPLEHTTALLESKLLLQKIDLYVTAKVLPRWLNAKKATQRNSKKDSHFFQMLKRCSDHHSWRSEINLHRGGLSF